MVIISKIEADANLYHCVITSPRFKPESIEHGKDTRLWQNAEIDGLSSEEKQDWLFVPKTRLDVPWNVEHLKQKQTDIQTHITRNLCAKLEKHRGRLEDYPVNEAI